MKSSLRFVFHFFILFNLAFITSCRNETSTEPILVSKDSCHHCKMTITDKRFGAEFVTKKGKVYKFDSIECMGHYLEDHKDIEGKAYVIDSFHDQKLIPFRSALFYHDPSVRSPMGKGIFAAENSKDLTSSQQKEESLLKAEAVLKLIGRPEIIDKL